MKAGGKAGGLRRLKWENNKNVKTIKMKKNKNGNQ